MNFNIDSARYWEELADIGLPLSSKEVELEYQAKCMTLAADYYARAGKHRKAMNCRRMALVAAELIRDVIDARAERQHPVG